MEKMKKYKGSMISEDMSAPGNLPTEVVRSYFGKDSGINFNYEGTSDAMRMQEMDDIATANRIKAKRRY